MLSWCYWTSCKYFFSSEAQRLADHGDPLLGGRGKSIYVGIIPQCMWFNSSLWKEEKNTLSYFKEPAKIQLFIKLGQGERKWHKPLRTSIYHGFDFLSSPSLSWRLFFCAATFWQSIAHAKLRIHFVISFFHLHYEFCNMLHCFAQGFPSWLD